MFIFTTVTVADAAATPDTVTVPVCFDLITPGQYSMSSQKVVRGSPATAELIVIVVLLVSVVLQKMVAAVAEDRALVGVLFIAVRTAFDVSTVVIVTVPDADAAGIVNEPRCTDRTNDRIPNCATRESSAEPVRAFCGPCRMTTG